MPCLGFPSAMQQVAFFEFIPQQFEECPLSGFWGPMQQVPLGSISPPVLQQFEELPLSGWLGPMQPHMLPVSMVPGQQLAALPLSGALAMQMHVPAFIMPEQQFDIAPASPAPAGAQQWPIMFALPEQQLVALPIASIPPFATHAGPVS